MVVQENKKQILVIKVPTDGIIVKLVHDDRQKNLQRIYDAGGSSLGVGVGDNKTRISKPPPNLKIYNDLTGNTYKLWKDYMPGDTLLEDNQNLLLKDKYVDLNDIANNPIGGRSSRKKYKKSSKRKHGRSMKRNASSNSRKYSRRK